MNKYWVKYTKGEAAKYISHLDFVRAMNRTFRRGRVPIAYSNGFNPHPLVSFALPLSVGVTGECEFIELELTEDIAPSLLLEQLNSAAPSGLVFTDANFLENKNALKGITWALYKITPKNLPSLDEIKAFLENKEIIIDKRTKSGTKPTDIRSMIKAINLIDNSLFVTISAGSVSNLKPDTLISAMEKYIEGYSAGFSAFHRIKLYNEELKELPCHE